MSVAGLDVLSAFRLLLTAVLLALLPLCWWVFRHHSANLRLRVLALLTLTAFLTFDLIVFGAFTRLTDSGLGCPDWPGCYGQASPIGAADDIHAAELAMPNGPVSHQKAWIEMIHRYLAMMVGELIVVLAAVVWRYRAHLPLQPWWPTATVVWVVVQGLFGKYTVTLKLHPAVVTLHLLGGMVLLALLVAQRQRLIEPRVRWQAQWLPIFALLVLTFQMALGAWVSSNYAVLACSGFPQCNGHWWPAMDFENGFTVMRALGRTGDGSFLPLPALVAIHVTHRAFAILACMASATLAWRLRSDAATRRLAAALWAVMAVQLGTGLSNVVLGWPLLAALLHTAGAALWVVVLTRAALQPRWHAF